MSEKAVRVVFLGYSLTDSNVESVLDAIVSCLNTEERIARLSDRLDLRQWDEHAERPSMAPSVIPVDGNPIPVMTVTVSDYREVFSVLGELRRRFSARLLRQLKEQVYELVLREEPAASARPPPRHRDRRAESPGAGRVRVPARRHAGLPGRMGRPPRPACSAAASPEPGSTRSAASSSR